MENSIILNDFMIEVLKRLPIKSLMRFKCVSKHWHSLITDPTFASLYMKFQKGSNKILIQPPNPHSSKTERRRFFVIDRRRPPSSRASIHDPYTLPPTVNSTSNIVNGLICFYSNSDIKEPIYLYNLTTREYYGLPHIDHDEVNLGEEIFTRECRLGYDPDGKVYKVLHLWRSQDSCKCQVLTLGTKDVVWRKIDTSYVTNILGSFDTRCVPRNKWYWKQWRRCFIFSVYENCDHPGFCLDGVLYWSSHYKARVLHNFRDFSRKRVLIKFDVKNEKFDYIDLPPLDGITDIDFYDHFYDYQERGEYEEENYEQSLVQLHGRIAEVSICPPALQVGNNIVRKMGRLYIYVRRLVVNKDDGKPTWVKEKDDGKPTWVKEKYSHRECAVQCTEFGLLSRVNSVTKSDDNDEIAYIDGYDLTADEEVNFKVNNAGGVLKAGCGINLVKTVENIMPLTNIVFGDDQLMAHNNGI